MLVQELQNKKLLNVIEISVFCVLKKKIVQRVSMKSENLGSSLKQLPANIWIKMDSCATICLELTHAATHA